MKYWVYKESRILGPFDKEAVSGLPGLDAGTLVCAGDPAGSSWVPAGELEGLSGIASGAPGGFLDDVPSSIGLLDQLQIDSAGLVGDDEFPGSFAEEMFQDASFKKGFGDVLSARSPSEEAEARRARDKISELTAQLEAMYRHVSELESGQTDLARRLAEKEAVLRAGAPVADAAAAPAKTFLSPAPPPIPGGPPPVAAVPAAALPEPPVEWPAAPTDAAGFPALAPSGLTPAKAPEPKTELPPTPELPVIPSLAPAAAAPSEAPAPVLEPAPAVPAPAAPKPLSFGKPKSFKVVPTVKSFKVLGADEAATASSANPVPEFKVEPVAEATPVPPPPPAPAPVMLEPAPVPVMAPAPEPAPAPNPFTLPERPPVAAQAIPAPAMPIPTPASPPPNTLSRAQPVPDLTSGDLAGSSAATSMMPPPATMARSADAAEQSVDAAAARFAKPAPAPATGEIKKPARNNKVFLIAGGVLVTMLVIVGVIFMRQPKDDLKQMTSLDDGKAPIGLPADDVAAPPPIVKPKIAEAPPVEAPPPSPPGPSAEHTAAIEAVKDFPLDGDRGTVGRWLQYSYTASPGAGTEEWNASTTGDNTVLVEYRMIPGSTGGRGALYLFEIDSNGIVMGKNIEARQMLAGGPPPEPAKAKKKPVKKAATRRRAVIEEPKEVPLLPLPDSGELRPPAEDDGTFGSDTINSGI